LRVSKADLPHVLPGYVRVEFADGGARLWVHESGISAA
jgi:hypothetical protein